MLPRIVRTYWRSDPFAIPGPRAALSIIGERRHNLKSAQASRYDLYFGQGLNAMKKVLLTGFGAYGNTPINPAKAVAEVLDGQSLDDGSVVSHIVPALFFKSIESVASAITEFEPNVVVMLGEYGGRAMVTVERLAHNFNDATRYGLADNDGYAPQDVPTVPDAPAAYYASVPIRAMVRAMRTAGIPADISDTPGTLICNHLMYGVLHHIATHRLPIRAGWIHLPHLPVVAAQLDNLGAPSMSAETAAAGVRAALQAAVTRDTDINEAIRSRWQI